MNSFCDNVTSGSPTAWDHETFPGRPDTIRVETDAVFGAVEIHVDGEVFPGVPTGDGWEVTIEWPKVTVLPMQLVVDGRIVTTGILRVTTSPVCTPTDDPLTVTTGGDVVLELTVLGGGSPPVAGDGIDVVGYQVSVDATVVRDDDVRLTDARVPLPHTHPATDVTGLAGVATTGAYGDLSGAPTIPSTADDVGAVPADGLPARIVGDGTTASVTGAGTEADPLVVASHGGLGALWLGPESVTNINGFGLSQGRAGDGRHSVRVRQVPPGGYLATQALIPDDWGSVESWLWWTHRDPDPGHELVMQVGSGVAPVPTTAPVDPEAPAVATLTVPVTDPAVGGDSRIRRLLLHDTPAQPGGFLVLSVRYHNDSSMDGDLLVAGVELRRGGTP